MFVDKTQVRVEQKPYNNIFIVENRNHWPICAAKCNKAGDLILCLDFALKLQLENDGYAVQFADHLIDRDVMQAYNFEMHNFLSEWYKAADGTDLLAFRGFNLGDSLLLNVLNDITYFCHFFFNLLALKQIDYKELYVVSGDEPLIVDILKKTGIEFTLLEGTIATDLAVFAFPISKWMNEKVNRTTLKSKLKDFAALSFDRIFQVIDGLIKRKKRKIFIQGYFPTHPVIDKLKEDKSLNLILANYTNLKTIYKERRVNFKEKAESENSVSQLIAKFSKGSRRQWIVDGFVLSDFLFELILPVVRKSLPDATAKAKSVQKFFDRNQIRLMVPVTNLWLTNRLIMHYCKNNNIPVFMVINGLLNASFLHDAKDSDWVNCYSESIKKEYFGGSERAVPLGDPRMDSYALAAARQINRDVPTIIIGAAGFDPTDLNAYLAYEFDFLFDILTVIAALRKAGRNNKIVLKVRANGYASLYRSLIDEYFSELDVQIEQDMKFRKVIEWADLYVSFYSQTVFEASALGIPVIYYKKDQQFLHAPFDSGSELVTAHDQTELKHCIEQFYAKDNIYDTFGKREVMEQYIGMLDGNNTKRNLDFIYKLVNTEK